MERSLTRKEKMFAPSEEQEIAAKITSAIAQFPVKRISYLANATDESVKGWRAERHVPGFTKAMRLGRRVPAIRNAIYEILDGGEPRNTSHERLVTLLLGHLTEIAVRGDEVSAARARRALQEFAEIAGAENNGAR